MAEDSSVDVLISYKRDERHVAERLAVALTARGWQVWWDHHILAGDAYRKVIGEKLGVARCVIVLWSTRSVQSDFVLDEAGRAHRRGVLVPVRLEAVEIPLGFGQQDYTDLIDWAGEEDHPGFQEVCQAVQRRLTGAAPPSPGPHVRTPRLRTISGRTAAAVGAIALAALGGWVWSTRAPSTPAPLAVQLTIGSQVVAAGLVLPSGYIVTPCHVIPDGDDDILIRGAGRWDGPARVRERQCDFDLALIESARGRLLPNSTVVRFAGSLSKGDPIERYRGASDRTPGTVIAPLESRSYLGTDAAPMRLLVTTNVSAGGDSGAPILDSQLRVVGMLVAGDGVTSSLAIPTETIREAFINSFAP